MPTYPQKRFHYKEAEIVKGAKSLQDMLRESFEQYPKPSSRTQKLSASDELDDGENLVISYRATHRGMTCGVLQRYKEGAKILAMKVSDDAENYEMQKFDLPRTKKERLELSNNILYFGALGNHLVFTQKPGFDYRVLQEHFQWLIDRRCQSARGEGLIVLLKDHIPNEYRTDGPVGVRRITLLTEPELRASGPDSKGARPTEQSPTATTAESGSKPPEQSWVIDDDPLVKTVLKMLKMHAPAAQQSIIGTDVLTLADAYQKGALRARIQLEVVNARSDKSPLDAVAREVLSTDGLDWEMELPHKEPFRSKDARLSRTYAVRCVDDVVDPKSAFEKMVKLIEDLVKDAKIEPDP